MAIAAQPTFTTEFALTYKAMMLGRIQQEQKTTRKVIAAIPNQKLDYRPDPKSRTALEIADHMASGEIWFLNSIADGKFEWKEPTPAKSVQEVLAHYDRDFKPAWERASKVTGEQLLAVVDFFGM